ncbi:hypothetical protein Tco_0797571 [Tanacetum coccineum]
MWGVGFVIVMGLDGHGEVNEVESDRRDVGVGDVGRGDAAHEDNTLCRFWQHGLDQSCKLLGGIVGCMEVAAGVCAMRRGA